MSIVLFFYAFSLGRALAKLSDECVKYQDVVMLMMASVLLFFYYRSVRANEGENTTPGVADSTDLAPKKDRLRSPINRMSELDDRPLFHRQEVRTCRRVPTVCWLCAVAAVAIGTLAIYLSNDKKCEVSSVYLTRAGGYNVYYKYKATGGTDCDTTAQRDTLAGSVKKWVKDNHSGKVCAFNCLYMAHGDTWKGFVTFGTDRWFVTNARCDKTTGEYSFCENGSVNNLGKRTVVEQPTSALI